MSNKPIIALIYDFDNTLSTHDMQEFTFIPALGMSPTEFWTKCDEIAHVNSMDHILAYMYLMAQKAKEKGIDTPLMNIKRGITRSQQRKPAHASWSN